MLGKSVYPSHWLSGDNKVNYYTIFLINGVPIVVVMNSMKASGFNPLFIFFHCLENNWIKYWLILNANQVQGS